MYKSKYVKPVLRHGVSIVAGLITGITIAYLSPWFTLHIQNESKVLTTKQQLITAIQSHFALATRYATLSNKLARKQDKIECEAANQPYKDKPCNHAPMSVQTRISLGEDFIRQKHEYIARYNLYLDKITIDLNMALEHYPTLKPDILEYQKWQYAIRQQTTYPTSAYHQWEKRFTAKIK